MKVISVLVVVLLLPVSVWSQKSAPANDQSEAPDEKRLRAISMVAQTAEEATLWDDYRTAVDVLADAADLIWDENPTVARRWLRRAWALIDQIPESPKNLKLKDYYTHSDRTVPRTIVLRAARRHDERLAEEFLKQLSQENFKDKKERGAFDDRSARSEQLLMLAQQIVDTDPEQAFYLASTSLADGISYNFQNVLTRLRTKNLTLADQLFDRALARFSSGPADPTEAEVLAGYLFLSGFTFSSNTSGQVILSVNMAQRNQSPVFKTEPQRARNFLVAAYQTLLTRPIPIETPQGRERAQRVLVFGNRIVGHYDALAPEFAVPVKAFLTYLQSQLLPAGDNGPFGGPNRSNSSSETTTKLRTKEEIYDTRLTQLEEKADKETDPIARKLAYVEAALAPTPQDYRRATRIAAKIADDTLRLDVVSFVLYRAALYFVGKGDIETASEIAPKVSDGLRRAVVRIGIAQRLMAEKPSAEADPSHLSWEQQRVFDLLSDVERDLKTQDPSAKVAKILLGRTALLAKLDSEQGFISLESAIATINRLQTFDPKDGAAPDLGLGASEVSGATVNVPPVGFSLRSALEPRVTTDFEQLAGIVERLKLKSPRGVARLEVARLYLRTAR